MVKLVSKLNTGEFAIIFLFLRKVRTQLWLNIYCKNISIALKMTVVMLIILILLAYYNVIFSIRTILYLSSFPIISTIIYTLYCKPSIDDSALVADDLLATKSILMTALELISNQKKGMSEFSSLVIQHTAHSITHKYNTIEHLHCFRSISFPWLWLGITISCLLFTLNSIPPLTHFYPISTPTSIKKTLNIASTLKSEINRLDSPELQQNQFKINKKVDNHQIPTPSDKYSQSDQTQIKKAADSKKTSHNQNSQLNSSTPKIDNMTAGNTKDSMQELISKKKGHVIEEKNMTILLPNKAIHTYRGSNEKIISKNFQFTQEFNSSKLSAGDITSKNAISLTNMFTPVQRHYAITYLKSIQVTD